MGEVKTLNDKTALLKFAADHLVSEAYRVALDPFNWTGESGALIPEAEVIKAELHERARGLYELMTEYENASDLLTVRMMAEELGVHKQNMHRWIRVYGHILFPAKVGRNILVRRENFEAFRAWAGPGLCNMPKRGPKVGSKRT